LLILIINFDGALCRNCWESKIIDTLCFEHSGDSNEFYTQFFWATLMSPIRTKHMSVDTIWLLKIFPNLNLNPIKNVQCSYINTKILFCVFLNFEAWFHYRIFSTFGLERTEKKLFSQNCMIKRTSEKVFLQTFGE
jgi:hypothetical protein